MALTTRSLTSPLKKPCRELGQIASSDVYDSGCIPIRTNQLHSEIARFMSPSQRVVMEDGYTVLFRAGHTKAVASGGGVFANS